MRNIAFEWADAYDTKEWDRLRGIVGPALTLDFRSITGDLHENMTPDEYVAFVSDKALLGDKSIQTQHLLGGAKWEQLDNGEVTAEHQTRVAHQRYTDDSLTTVLNSGHGQGNAKHWYRKVDGKWKLVKVEPHLRWSEYDLMGVLQAKEDGFVKVLLQPGS